MTELPRLPQQPAELEIPPEMSRSLALPGGYAHFDAGAGPIDAFERLDFAAVWSALWQARYRIAASAVLVGIWAWMLTGLLSPRYEALAILRVDGAGVDVLSDGKVDPNRYIDPVDLSTRIQSIKAAAVLRDAADAAGIRYSPEFNAALSHNADTRQEAERLARESDADRAASVLTAFAKQVDVWQVAQSGVAAIKVKAGDPLLAARAANAIGDAYIQHQIREKRRTRLRAMDALLAQQDDMARKLSGVENAIAAARGDRKLVFSEAQDIRGQVLGKTRELLITAEAELAEAERKRLIVDQVRRGGADTLAAVTFSDLINRLREQRAVLAVELAQLATEAGPSHPRYAAAANGIEKVDRAIDQELERISASVRNDERGIRDRVQSLASRLAKLDAEVTDQATGRVRLDSLETEGQALRYSRETLKTEIDKLKTGLGLEQSEATFVSRAVPPEKRSFPKRTVIAAAASVAWSGFFAFFVAAMTLANRQVRKPEDTAAFEAVARCPVVGALPAEAQPFKITLGQMPQDLLQGLQRIAAAVGLGPYNPVSLVVSPIKPGDGGTTTAVALARLSAQAGLSTLLVELDGRRRISELLDLGGAFGLADCAQSGVDPVSAVLPRPDLGFHLLAHGQINDGFGGRAGAALDQAVEKLKSLYRVVIISAPPLSQSPRAFWAGRGADHVIIVTAPDKRRAETLARYFRFFGGVVPGNVAVVFNRVDVKDFAAVV
jgi:uncharacterized protein involved in exopolysaccharide biosynthesis